MIITESLAKKRNQRLILCNAQKSQNKKTKENIDFLTGKNPGKSTRKCSPDRRLSNLISDYIRTMNTSASICLNLTSPQKGRRKSVKNITDDPLVYFPLEYQTIQQSYQKKNKTEWKLEAQILSRQIIQKMLPKNNSLQHNQVCKQSRRNTGMSRGQQSAWRSPDFWCNQQKNRTVRTDDIPACIIIGKNKQVLLQISFPPTKGHADHCPSLW